MYISRKQKRNISVWIILAVFLLAGVFLFSNLDKKSDPEMAKQLSGSELADGNQVIEDSLSTTLKDYLSDKEGSISDEEMEQLHSLYLTRPRMYGWWNWRQEDMSLL